MPQGVHDTIVIYRVGHVIRHLFHLVVSVTHGYPDPGVAKHGHIVASIAKGHRLGERDPVMLDDLIDPYRLTAPPRHDIRE